LGRVTLCGDQAVIAIGYGIAVWFGHAQRPAKQVVVGDGVGLAEILRLEGRRGGVINTIGFGFFCQAT